MNSISEEKLRTWKNLIEEKKQSGLMLKDFCKEKNITPAKFYYYHAIITRSNKISPPKKGNIAIKPITIVNSSSKESNVIRFILPNGLQCIFPQDMLPQKIKEMLEIAVSC